jgi:uncharacterized protein (DUF362 family)
MDFLNIKTVFNDNSQRNIQYLSSLYENKQFLYETIQSLIEPHLCKKDFYNKKVLLKPNWVKHCVKEPDDICLCTNENFIIATLEYILEQNPQSIIIGDAPIQGCKWEKLLSSNFYKEIEKLKTKFSIDIEIKDFRRTTLDIKNNKIVKEIHPISDYIIFDVGKSSYLEPISKNNKNLFRVTDYDPDRLAQSHRPGTHKYCIIKDIFDADIIITIPKIKTHQKSGFTNSLKIFVGINGDKDFLPHHRKGGTKNEGDCYPGFNLLRKYAENLIDYSNKNIGKWNFRILRKMVSLLWKLSKPTKEHNLGAAWYGNDTIWRMVMDLNKVALYGKKDGTLADTPQRNIFTLCDGIIAGQGDGPLLPTPLELGVVSFSNNSYYTDICIAQLLQIDVDKISLLKEAKKYCTKEIELKLNNKRISEQNLPLYSIEAKMPPGWINYKKI